jgi:ribosome-associated protein
LGEKPAFTEGKENKEWILVDFIDVVVHVFQEPTRRFYNIEKLWADAKIKTLKI